MFHKMLLANYSTYVRVTLNGASTKACKVVNVIQTEVVTKEEKKEKKKKETGLNNC